MTGYDELFEGESGSPQLPLFPESVGAVLHAILNAEPEPGPPWTHTFRPPEPEYDDEGRPYWPLEKHPHYTITDVET